MAAKKKDEKPATKDQREELGAPEGADIGNMKPIETDEDNGPDLEPKFAKDPSDREGITPVVPADAEHVFTHDETKNPQHDLQSVYVQPKGK